MAKRKPRRSDPSLFDAPDIPESPPAAPPPPSGPEGVPLHEAAQSRYLNYALSVITSRALPDVRDGLKPVQRRILYTMWQQGLTADTKHKKCAKVVGDVMGNYHPHGDAAISDALLGDIEMNTVPFRPNYDGTREEPVVLPSKLPTLLVNGAAGIAVGMATNIPPHNGDEVCQAAIRLLDALQEGRELSSRELCRTLKGPDFPTGGRIISS